MKKIIFVMIFLSFSIVTFGKQALTDPENTKNVGVDEARLLRSTDPEAQRFRSVGKLLAHSHCTATLIVATDKVDPNQLALIITAGHCIEETNGNDVIVDAPANHRWAYTPNYFIDTQADQVPISINRIVYSTMKSVDLAILRLSATYGELEKTYKIFPMRLQLLTNPYREIEVTHIPVIGIPIEQQFLRYSDCKTEGARSIYEGDSPWFWPIAIPNNCNGIYGGSSGAPVFLKGQSRIIGIMNTTVEKDLNGCGRGRPCEFNEKGGVAREGASYFIPITRIAHAFNDAGQLDLNKLDDGKGVVAEHPGFWITQNYMEDENGQFIPARWNINIDNRFTHVRYKTGLAKIVNCADSSGYTDSLPVSDQPLHNLLVPAKENIYTLCVVGQHAENGKWQSIADATQIFHEIDNTPPTAQAKIALHSDNDTAWEVYGSKNPYEITSFMIKYGPLASTDCNDMNGYFRPVQMWERLDKAKAPWRFCTVGRDSARNQGPVNMRDFVQ